MANLCVEEYLFRVNGFNTLSHFSQQNKNKFMSRIWLSSMPYFYDRIRMKLNSVLIWLITNTTFNTIFDINLDYLTNNFKLQIILTNILTNHLPAMITLVWAKLKLHKLSIYLIKSKYFTFFDLPSHTLDRKLQQILKILAALF